MLAGGAGCDCAIVDEDELMGCPVDVWLLHTQHQELKNTQLLISI